MRTDRKLTTSIQPKRKIFKIAGGEVLSEELVLVACTNGSVIKQRAIWDSGGRLERCTSEEKARVVRHYEYPAITTQ